jgi:hypothetical protein
VFNVCLQPAFTTNDNCSVIQPAVQCPLKTVRVVDAAGQLEEVAKSDVAGQRAACCDPIPVSITPTTCHTVVHCLTAPTGMLLDWTPIRFDWTPIRFMHLWCCIITTLRRRQYAWKVLTTLPDNLVILTISLLRAMQACDDVSTTCPGGMTAKDSTFTPDIEGDRESFCCVSRGDECIPCCQWCDKFTAGRQMRTYSCVDACRWQVRMVLQPLCGPCDVTAPTAECCSACSPSASAHSCTVPPLHHFVPAGVPRGRHLRRHQCRHKCHQQ